MTELKLFLVFVSIDESKLQPAKGGHEAYYTGSGFDFKDGGNEGKSGYCLKLDQLTMELDQSLLGHILAYNKKTIPAI